MIILVGSEEAVKKGSEGLDLTGAVVVDPATSDRTQAYIDKLVELRQKKGMTPDTIPSASPIFTIITP